MRASGLALLAAGCLSLGTAWAQPAPREGLFETFARQPGARIVQTGPDGQPVAVEVNGVVMTRMVQGGRTIVAGVDRTGRGAVLCIWMMLNVVQMALEACHSDDDIVLRQETAASVQRMLDFILANDLERRPRAEWEAVLDHQRRPMRDQLSSTDPTRLANACRTGPVGDVLRNYRSMPPAERQRMVDDLLSIPRHPVLNPCL